MRISSRAKKLVMRLRLLGVLALLVPGLVVVIGTGVAHAAPGHTISTATTLGMGVTATYFDLYVSTTNDANFPKATAFTSGATNHQAKATVTLQAPYTGTFVLAVCENVVPCSVASKTAVMNPYTFTTGLIVS